MKFLFVLILAICLTSCTVDRHNSKEEGTESNNVEFDSAETRRQVEEKTKKVGEETIDSLKGIKDTTASTIDENLDEQSKEDLANLRDSAKDKVQNFAENDGEKLRDIGGIILDKGREAVDEIRNQ